MYSFWLSSVTTSSCAGEVMVELIPSSLMIQSGSNHQPAFVNVCHCSAAGWSQSNSALAHTYTCTFSNLECLLTLFAIQACLIPCWQVKAMRSQLAQTQTLPQLPLVSAASVRSYVHLLRLPAWRPRATA
jgi:hypothetical protein